MKDCCNGCVPPKRTPTCKFDGTCPDYIIAKAFHDAELAAKNKENSVRHGLSAQTELRVRAADKRKRKLGRLSWRRSG